MFYRLFYGNALPHIMLINFSAYGIDKQMILNIIYITRTKVP